MTIASPNSISQYLASGLSVRRIAALTKVPWREIELLKREQSSDHDGICRTVAQADRLRRYGKDIPSDQRLGWTCNVAYCWNPKHFVLVEKRNLHFRDYKPIRAQLVMLKEGEWFDLPDEPNDSKSVTKFRAALQVNSPHFLVRALPRQRGLRIIRYGGYFEGMAAFLRAHPALWTAKKPQKNGQIPGTFYHGLLWGCWQTRPQASKRCVIKACFYPAFAGPVCRFHSLDELAMQYHRDLDSMDMVAPKDIPWMPLTLYKAPIGWDKRGFLNTETYWPNRAKGYGAFEKKSSAEKTNDKWWQENVINKGLVTDADGIMHKFNSEEQLRHALEAAHWEQSIANIRSFFGGGSGSLNTGRYKRLGGGGGKIRKAQRKRPAGWHGSRDDRKLNRPDRETIEFEGEEEFDDHTPLEDDYGEDSVA